MPDIPELEHKLPPISIALIIGVIAVIGYGGFTLGTIVARSEAVEILQDTQHEFALDEVSGLRNDVVKEDDHLQNQIDELKERIEKYHPLK